MEPPGARSATSAVIGGRYGLIDRVARGAMAHVWRAEDRLLHRIVAVKLLDAALHANPVSVERFRREAMAAARLSHPNIVAVYDTISEPGVEAIVMELVEGQSLREVLNRRGCLDVAETARIGTQVLAALEAAHRHGIVHRDIKPANILVAHDGRVLLADFGIAKTALDTEFIDLTSDDVMVGTAKYLSPEQVMGAAIEPSSDLFSLGVVLFECLTGAPPFTGSTDAAVALARLQRSAPLMQEARPGTPAGLAHLVDSLLEIDLEDRPRSAAAVRYRLQKFVSSMALDPTASSVSDGTVVLRLEPSKRLLERPDQARPSEQVGDLGDHLNPHHRRIAGRLRQPRRAVHTLAAVLLIGALVVVGIVLGTTQVGLDWFRSSVERSTLTGPTPTIALTALAQGDPSTTGRPVAVDAVVAFDPFGDGRERSALLPNLIDGNPDTSWSTERYDGRNLAGKPGVGVVLTLVDPPASIKVEVVGKGSDYSIELFRSEALPADLRSWGTAADVRSNVTGDTSLTSSGRGRFLLLWITDPGKSDPQFRLDIGEVVVHG